jgi:Type IV secretion system pilin
MIRINMKRYIKYSLLIFALILIPLSVFGQTVTINNPLNTNDILVVLGRIINWIFTIAISIAVIMYIVAGLRFVTAAGEPEKISTAKRMALWTSIGLGIAIAAKGIVALVGEILGVNITF